MIQSEKHSKKRRLRGVFGNSIRRFLAVNSALVHTSGTVLRAMPSVRVLFQLTVKNAGRQPLLAPTACGHDAPPDLHEVRGKLLSCLPSHSHQLRKAPCTRAYIMVLKEAREAAYPRAPAAVYTRAPAALYAHAPAALYARERKKHEHRSWC